MDSSTVLPSSRQVVIIIGGLVSKVGTVQCVTTLSQPRSRGVHRGHRSMAIIAVTGLLWLSQIIYSANSKGQTVALPEGFVTVLTPPKYPPSITHPLVIHYADIIYHAVC